MTQFRRIVCPTDFSPTAEAAMRYAASIAQAYGAELVLLHVLPQVHYPLRGLGMASAFPHLQEELHTRAKERLQAALATISGVTKIDTELRDGEAYDGVLACAKERHADLIVLSDDYFRTSDDAIKDIRSNLTIVDGRIVRSAQPGDELPAVGHVGQRVVGGLMLQGLLGPGALRRE